MTEITNAAGGDRSSVRSTSSGSATDEKKGGALAGPSGYNSADNAVVQTLQDDAGGIGKDGEFEVKRDLKPRQISVSVWLLAFLSFLA